MYICSPPNFYKLGENRMIEKENIKRKKEKQKENYDRAIRILPRAIRNYSSYMKTCIQKMKLSSNYRERTLGTRVNINKR